LPKRFEREGPNSTVTRRSIEGTLTKGGLAPSLQEKLSRPAVSQFVGSTR